MKGVISLFLYKSYSKIFIEILKQNKIQGVLTNYKPNPWLTRLNIIWKQKMVST